MKPGSTGMTRRSLLTATILASPSSVAAQSQGCSQTKSPSGWCTEKFEGKTVYYLGSGPSIVLLHEIDGLSPACIDLGAELVKAGFTVHMPLLFGHAGEDNLVLGYFESCWGAFACGSGGTDMKISRWLRKYVDDLTSRALPGQGIGVIGMCLSGGLPLNVMTNPKVRAVVMSQPALPFGGRDKQDDVGVSSATMKSAQDSGTPILAFRFLADTICTGERFKYLQGYFGTQFTGRQLDPPAGFHSSWTHRLHAVLTGPFGDVRAKARGEVIAFMRQRLVGRP